MWFFRYHSLVLVAGIEQLGGTEKQSIARAPVKLFESGVRTPGGLLLGVYAVVLIIGVFLRQAFRFSA